MHSGTTNHHRSSCTRRDGRVDRAICAALTARAAIDRDDAPASSTRKERRS